MIKGLIPLQNGSQLLVEALDPNTMLVAKKYNCLAINPKAPVGSAWTLGKWKHTVMSARARCILLFGNLTLQLLMHWSNFNFLTAPKVTLASNSVVVTSFKTTSWGCPFVKASKIMQGFLPGLSNMPWAVCDTRERNGVPKVWPEAGDCVCLLCSLSWSQSPGASWMLLDCFLDNRSFPNWSLFKA